MSGCGCGPTEAETAEQRRVLWLALALNAVMFVVEVVAGLLAGSISLIADGLDMLTDASAYAIALIAIGRSIRFKANAATVTGAFLLLLGVGVLIDVARRAISGAPPEGLWMMAVAAVALAVNATVLTMLSKQRNGEVHLRATYICTRADVVANAAVILSGLIVLVTHWRFADLIIGAGIGVYVLKEAAEIFGEARHARRTSRA
jgi:cation diffusion facilitator family transporter